MMNPWKKDQSPKEPEDQELQSFFPNQAAFMAFDKDIDEAGEEVSRVLMTNRVRAMSNSLEDLTMNNLSINDEEAKGPANEQVSGPWTKGASNNLNGSFWLHKKEGTIVNNNANVQDQLDDGDDQSFWLSRPMALPRGERKEYECEDCPLKYATPKGLKNHKKVSHVRRRASDVIVRSRCSKCGLGFYSVTNHDNHKTTCQGASRRQLAKRLSLENGQATRDVQAGQRSEENLAFACENSKCDRTFAKRSHLRKHLCPYLDMPLTSWLEMAKRGLAERQMSDRQMADRQMADMCRGIEDM